MDRVIRITLPDGTVVLVKATYPHPTQNSMTNEDAMLKLHEHLKRIWPDGAIVPDIIPAGH